MITKNRAGNVAEKTYVSAGAAMDVRRASPVGHVSSVLIPATTCCRPRGSEDGGPRQLPLSRHADATPPARRMRRCDDYKCTVDD